jgi:two-component system, response regulator / RNA-binding antiterminator
MRHAEANLLRVLVVDESPERGEILRGGLEQAGYQVTGILSSPLELLQAVERLAPDVIIIDTDSPTRDVLEHVCVMGRDRPRPIVMFSADDDAATIRDAVRAGVSAYVVDGLEPERVKAIVEVACARFEEFQKLRTELAEANRELSERKLVERAKGLLMKARGVDEQEAYRLLRTAAMNRGRRIGDVAEEVIAAVELLGRSS